MTFSEQLLLGIVTAVAASILALAGNSMIQRAQSKNVVRAELRQFVRDQHGETVSTVADLDLFMRQIRAAVVVGRESFMVGGLTAREAIEQHWEGDLLRRLRILKFGHPDPDVRAAADRMEDAMWPYLTMAESPRERPGARSLPEESRTNALEYASEAMRLLRSAVWSAPRRNVPASARYDGADRPPYLARSMAGEHPDGSSRLGRRDNRDANNSPDGGIA